MNYRAETSSLKRVALVTGSSRGIGRAIAEHLAQKRTVILNMENTDSETSRRLLDFATGVVFSCDGKLRRVASKTYIVAPGLVDLSGELVDGMDGGDMPAENDTVTDDGGSVTNSTVTVLPGGMAEATAPVITPPMEG